MQHYLFSNNSTCGRRWFLNAPSLFLRVPQKNWHQQFRFHPLLFIHCTDQFHELHTPFVFQHECYNEVLGKRVERQSSGTPLRVTLDEQWRTIQRRHLIKYISLKSNDLGGKLYIDTETYGYLWYQ